MEGFPNSSLVMECFTIRVIPSRIDGAPATREDAAEVGAHLDQKFTEYWEKNNLPDGHEIEPDEFVALLESDDFKHPDYTFKADLMPQLQVFDLGLGMAIGIISNFNFMPDFDSETGD